jgi:hypothetical protein
VHDLEGEDFLTFGTDFVVLTGVGVADIKNFFFLASAQAHDPNKAYAFTGFHQLFNVYVVAMGHLLDGTTAANENGIKIEAGVVAEFKPSASAVKGREDA